MNNTAVEKTYSCGVIYNWYASIEKANFGIVSPSGKRIWIEKCKKWPAECKEVIWKVAELTVEQSAQPVYFTKKEMELLKKASDFQNEK